MKISMILAAAPTGVIGIGNKLPWHIPADLRRFKKLTGEHAVVMGRATADSLKALNVFPLPYRANWVVTGNPASYAAPGAKKYIWQGQVQYHDVNAWMTAPSLQSIISLAESHADQYQRELELFLIGGASIYEEAMATGIVDEIHLTRVLIDFAPHPDEVKVGFLGQLQEDWELLSSETFPDHVYEHWIRKNEVGI